MSLKLFSHSPMMDYLKVSGKHENFDKYSTITIMLFSFDVKCFFGWIYFRRETYIIGDLGLKLSVLNFSAFRQ